MNVPRARPAAIVVALCLLSAGLLAALYPPTYSILDEQGYLSYALALSKGHLFADQADVRVLRSRRAADDSRVAPSFPIGTSLLLAPAHWLDWRIAFGLIHAIHLLGTVACSAALRRAGLPVYWAALYLLHPVAVLYSRTAMSDIPTMALTMAGVAAWVGDRRRPALAGLALGLSLHFRYAQAATLAAFGLAVLVRDLIDSRRAGRPSFASTLWFSAGALPGFASGVAMAFVLYGELPSSDMSLGYLAQNLPRYLLTQNLVYPLCLLVAFLMPSALRLESVLVGLATLGLYGSFFHLYAGFGLLGSMLVGDRFFLPLFAVTVIPYATFLQVVGAWLGRLRLAALSAGAVALLAVAIGVHWVHQQRLLDQARIQDFIYANTRDHGVIVCNNLSSFEYLFDGIGPRQGLLYQWLVDADPLRVPGLLEQVERVPHLYLLSAERTDRPSRDAQQARAMLRWARSRWDLRLIEIIEREPDRVAIYQVVSR